MRHHDSRSLLRIILTVGAVALAGCEQPGIGGGLHLHRHHELAYTEEPDTPIEKAQPLGTVIDRVNQNSAGMTFLLRGGRVTAKGEYVERHKLEPYELKGTLLYRKQRDLYLKLQHSLGGTMEIGSNAQEFWVWKRLGKDHYWWGKQSSVDANQELDIPLRPTDLVEVLGFAELPRDVPKSDFKATEARYELRIPGRSAHGTVYTAKVVHIDRHEPHLVREIEFFDPDGQKRAIARLARYEEIDGASVRAPRHIQMEWPQRGGNMDLQIGSMQRYDSDAATGRFVSPLQQGRDVGLEERVD